MANSSDKEASAIGLHKRGWSGRDLSKQAMTLHFGAAQQQAILERLAAVRAEGLDLYQIDRRHFAHPGLDDFLAGALRQLKEGPGLVVLAGYPIEGLSLPEIEAVYWGVGTHFGDGVSQSSAGDLLGHVTDKSSAGAQTARGYQSNRELVMHTDSAEFAALLCVRRSRSGGENVFASALRIYELIHEEHPEFLPVVERGFPYHRRGEGPEDAAPISPYDVPVFSTRDGITSCRYGPELLHAGIQALGRALDPLEEAALDYIDRTALREDVRFDLQLEPGEAVFMNNFEILHARTGFEDWPEPERRRLLLRLWLQGRPTRPMKPEMHAYRNKGGRHGIDAQPGRTPGKIGYLRH